MAESPGNLAKMQFLVWPKGLSLYSLNKLPSDVDGAGPGPTL